MVFLIFFLADQFSIYLISKKYKKNIKFSFIVYLGIITKFFNGITPLSTGGQPMQVYEFYKKGIPVSKGTNIVVQNYICFQISLVFWGIVAVILNKTLNLFKYVPVLKQLTIIGFILNIAILILLFLASYSNKFVKKIAESIINFLFKIKLVKNKEKQLKKWRKSCDEYHNGAKVLLEDKKTFIIGIVSQLISLGAFYILPVFLAYAIHVGNNMTIINNLAAGAYIYLMGCYVPIPGASGGMEFAFLGFLGNFVKGFKLNALLVLWRFITYYLPTIIGGIVFNFGSAKEGFKKFEEKNIKA